MALPQDPNILASTINMYLRDKYSGLDELCKSEDIEKEILLKKLTKAGFEYSIEANKFW